MSETRLLFGFHAVTARLRADPDSLREILVHAGGHDPSLRDLIVLAEQHGVRVVQADEEL